MREEVVDISEIRDRLTQLDRRTRRMGFFLALFVAVSVVTGALALRRLTHALTTGTLAVGSVLLHVPGEAQILHASLAAKAEGAATLVFNDRAVRYRLGLGVASDGRPSIEFYDATGKRRILLGLDERDNPQLEMVDPEGRIVKIAQ